MSAEAPPRAGPVRAARLCSAVTLSALALALLAACAPATTVSGKFHDQFQVNPLASRTMAKSGDGGTEPANGQARPSNTPVFAIDLDTGKLPGTNVTAAMLGTTSEIGRNRVCEYMIYLSDQICGKHKAEIYANAAALQTGFSGLGTILGGLGAIVTGETATRALAGSAGIASGLGSNINENIYGNFLAPAIVAQIDRQRDAKLLEIRSLETKPLAQYPFDAMVRDVNAYHESCSFYAGVSGLTGEKKRLPTQEELIGRMQVLRQQMRANDEAADPSKASNATIKVLNDANAALGDQLKTTMQQLTAGLPGGVMTPLLPVEAKDAQGNPPKPQPPATQPAAPGTAAPAASGQ